LAPAKTCADSGRFADVRGGGSSVDVVRNMPALPSELWPPRRPDAVHLPAVPCSRRVAQLRGRAPAAVAAASGGLSRTV
jgi:hypothetical protein